MALYTEKSYDEVKNLLNSQNKSLGLGINNQIGRQASQNTIKNSGKAESSLESLLGGIGSTVSNIGKSLYSLVGNPIADTMDWINGTKSTSYSVDNMKEMLDVNRKAGASQDVLNSIQSGIDNAKNNGKVYGYIDQNTGKWVNANEGKESDAFKRWLWGEKSNGDINYANAAGSNLDAAATLADFIPGTNGVIGNTVKGAVSGFGNAYGQSEGNVEQALKGAATGAAAGLATSGVNKGINNIQSSSNKLINNKLTNNKLINSAIGRGAISGATGGAIGGGVNAALNNGNVLESALQGAGSGLLQGGVSGGAMALGTKVANKTPILNGVLGATQELEQDYQTKKLAKKLPLSQNVATEETTIDNVVNPIENTQEAPTTKNRIARPTEDKVYDTQLIDWENTDDGIRSVKFDNDDLNRWSVGNSLGTSLKNLDEATFDEIVSDPEIAAKYFPQEAQNLISKTLAKNNIPDTPESYKKQVSDGIWQFFKEDGNQGTQSWLVPNAAGEGSGYSKRVGTSDNSETYKWFYNEYGGKPSKEFIAQTMDDYYSGKMPENVKISLDNAFDFDRQRFANPNIPSADSEQKYMSLAVDQATGGTQNNSSQNGLTFDNFRKAMAADPTLETRLNNSLVKNGVYLDEAKITPETRQRWLNEANARQAESDAQYNELKNWARENADYLNEMNGWNAYDEQQAALKAAANTPEQLKDINRHLDTETDLYTDKTAKSYRSKEASELLKQYATVDKKTANATNPEDTVLRLKDAGFTKKADVEDIAYKITGKDGTLSELVNGVAKNSQNIETGKGPEGFDSIEDYVAYLVEDNGIAGLNEGDAVQKQISAKLRKLSSRKNGSLQSVDNGEEVLSVVRSLEASARKARGKDGNTYATAKPENLAQADILDNVADLLESRIFDNADVKSVLTPELAEKLKGYAPENKKWAEYVDNNIMQATDARQLRNAQSPFVRAIKILDNGAMNQITYGGRGGNYFNEKIPTTQSSIKNRVVNAAVNKIANSDPVVDFTMNKKLDYYENKARQAQATADANNGIKTQFTQDQPNIPTTTTTQPSVVNPQDFYNLIGRSQGVYQGTVVPSNLEQTLANQASNSNIQGQDMYSTGFGTTGTSQSLSGANNGISGTSYGTTQTRNNPLDTISQAMELALQAGDANAFSQLMGLYNDAYKIYGQTEETQSQTKLTATQQRANAAMNSLQRLSGMTPDTGYNLSGIPIIGNIATFGGNSYEAEAKSLAQQIGYMVSGANIKESEAENIGKAYVPQPFDSEQTRQQKLQRAAEIIQQYQNGYATE